MKRNTIIAFLGGILLIAFLLWLFDSPDVVSKKPKSISSQWDTEYNPYSTDPKGLSFFNELAMTHLSDSVYLVNNRKELDSLKKIEKATLVYIGEGLDLETVELQNLLARVDSGATLFLSFTRADRNSYSTFFHSNPYYWEYTNKAYVAVGDTSLAYCSVNQNDTIYSDWFTFNEKAFVDTLNKPFLFSMYQPAAVEMKRGKGTVILHAMPQLFFNYQVLSPNGYVHAAYCLRKIKRKEPLVWLEFARYYPPDLYDEGLDDGPGDERDNSYLQFIMQHEALRWAFMLALLVFISYVLFRAKRRQAILPGIPEKRNMSLAFVDTLSSIYLSRNSPYGLLVVLRKNFYMTVSRHFYIELVHAKTDEQKEKQEANIRRLVEKSDFDEEELRMILSHLDTGALKSHAITNDTITQLYKSIRRFYIQNGIIKEPAHFVRANEEVLLHRSLLTGGVVTLLGMIAIMRGLYLLAAGNGLGIVLVIFSALVLYVGIRFLSTPVGKITRDTLTAFMPFFGKKSIAAQTDELTFSTNNGVTVFYNSAGEELTIKHALLSRSGRNALRLFTEHLKQKAS